MDDASSPPPTPSRSSTTTRPHIDPRRRRTSSVSSNHDRSPLSPRKSSHRFSNTSFGSNTDFSAVAEGGGGRGGGGGEGGGGNLADELDELDDEEEEEEEEYNDDGVMETRDGEERQDGEKQPGPVVDGARDSGIDVSYSNSEQQRKAGGSAAQSAKPGERNGPEEAEGGDEDRLASELEDLINAIARMAASTPSPSAATDDPLVSRAISLLQDLGNQSSLESNTQRLTTSTNSMTGHLTSQAKAIQTLSTTLLHSPWGAVYSSFLDPEALSDTVPLISSLLTNLPHPDPAPLQGLQKLDLETANLVSTLSQLTDTLQMGKQASNAASRHLRNTQTMVVELRRERERAEAARAELQGATQREWEDRIKRRWCREQCRDVMEGFEKVCEELREGLMGANRSGLGVVA